MKPSRAIATFALVISAILKFTPTVATADYWGKAPGRRRGVVPCPNSTGSAADVVANTIISWAQVTLWM